ncbi:MAG: hypothetical protein RMJ19_02240 [Gemmatales bacterium]|nr:hypothetical protein [Gemmatales bacterium]MDW8174467.1 hypothetical protein [Gemmatales bacterium]
MNQTLISPVRRCSERTWEEKIECLRRIRRGEDYYGEGDPNAQARRYYFDHMFWEVVHRARERSFGDKPRQSVYLLISLLGYSPETTLLTFELLQPCRLLVITSQETEHELDWIDRYLIRSGRIPLARFERRDYNPRAPFSIFRIIEERVESDDVKQEYIQARQQSGNNERRIPVVVDITGGKKVLGAVAALAAWEFNALPCYLDGDIYDQDLRRPLPGTESLLILDQALSQFGGQEMKTAIQLFRAGAFEPAYEQFRRLAERIAYPEQARLFRDVSELYSAWCNLDMDQLRQCADKLKAQVEQASLPIRHAVSRILREQLDYLEKLIQRDRDSLVLNYYLLGLHHQESHRYDFAALLFYRTIEGCFTRRLEKRSAEFNPRRPEYSLLGDPENLFERYKEIALKLDPKFELKALPHRISMMDAAVLLCVLEDELMKRAELCSEDALGHLRQLAELRNQSVLAHGYRSVSREDAQNLQSRAKHILRVYWQLTYPEQDLDQRLQALRFLKEFPD